MSEIILYIFLFATGAALGSFISVLIDRLPRGEGVVNARSRCESCGKTLSAKELIPIVSYLLLKGKCRSCKGKIPTRLLIFEVFSGLLLIAIYYFSFYIAAAPLPYFLLSAILVYGLLVIYFIDYRHGIIPDSILIVMSIVLLLYYTFFARGLFIESVLSGLGAFIVFLTLFLATLGRGIGFGDVKFAFVIGLMCGFPGVIVAFYLSFLTGAAVSLILILRKKKKLRGSTIPFGPFLVVGTVIAYFFGQNLFDWFIQLL